MNHAKHDLLMFAVVSLLVFEPLFITQKTRLEADADCAALGRMRWLLWR